MPQTLDSLPSIAHSVLWRSDTQALDASSIGQGTHSSCTVPSQVPRYRIWAVWRYWGLPADITAHMPEGRDALDRQQVMHIV